MSYLYVLITVALTVYGQLIIKWRVTDAGEAPGSDGALLGQSLRLLLDPWVISSLLAAAVAAVAYISALADLPLSKAYPVMSLSFVLVLVLSAVFFRDTLTVGKLVGVSLILAGIALAAR